MFNKRLSAGHGFGLRVPHYAELERSGASGVDLVEALTENFLGRGGRPRALLQRVLADVPVVLHGVSLSIGATSPLNDDYLRQLRQLCDWVNPPVVSDHLCFATHGVHYGHDLWPLPYTEEAVAVVVSRVTQVQDRLGRQLALENVSSYLTYVDSGLTEWQFLGEIATRADCGILLDINNVYVSARNHGFAPETYLDALPVERIAQIHLAGHSDKGSFLLDDHSTPVPAAVWSLYERLVARAGAIPTVIEWDENVPTLQRLTQESEKARLVAAAVLSRKSAQKARAA